MSDRQQTSHVSAVRLALAIKRMRAEQPNLDLPGSEPIAIVGMGCRFPGGGNSPAEFWEALKQGRDGIREVPEGRWKQAGTLPAHLRRGGFLDPIDEFDPTYFGISPREAQQMDPQQRLLLEVIWESLWDAGIEPESLSGTSGGVFAAIYNADYARLNFRDAATLTAHAGSGTAHHVAAGRVAFLLNLTGPCLAINSACSSSLVALHLACQSLRARECNMAVVGASSLKLLPDEVQVFSQWGMLSAGSRCKTFDAAADGFVPGEGVGALILKPLADALEAGDRVRAVIRGSAVNQDGRTTVLTAPSGLAQESVLRAALANARVRPEQVDYIETHGTGTALGDPIEVEAIASVYGGAAAGVPPCVLGAVKSNIGHLEAAAGLAGTIKAVLCLEHGEIPRNLHFEKLNPEISFDRTRLALALEDVAWPRSERPRFAGVSSFGASGTNSHVVLEESPNLPQRSPAEQRRTIPLAGHRWEQKKFWLAEPVAKQASAVESFTPIVPTRDSGHPLLGRRIDSPFIQGSLFASEINAASIPYLAEHRLGERALVPFAAFLEIASAGVRDTGTHSTIRNFAMREPCFISAAHRGLQVRVTDHDVEIVSESATGWSTHAKGLIASDGIEAAHIDLEELRARCSRPVAPEEIYRDLERTGLRYGPAFRTIRSAWAGDGEALAHVEIAKELISEAQIYGLHPTILDACLQTVVAARGESSDDLFLPIAIDCFDMERPGLSEVWVHTKITASSADALSADLVMMDANGHVAARMTGFTAKRTSRQRVESIASEQGRKEAALIYEIDWRAEPRTPSNGPATTRNGEHWLLIESREGSSRALADVLERQGAVCAIVADRAFRRSHFANVNWSGVVYDARGIKASGLGTGWQYPEKPGIECAFEFVRAMADSKAASPRMWIISSSAVSVLPSENVAVESAPLWGMVRTLALEYPEAAPVLIDAGVDDANSETAETEAMLAEEIAARGDEPMVAVRNGKRYVARLVRPALESQPVRKLGFSATGRLEDLRVEPTERRELAANEVEIEVRAAGLNFRDVLTALGMLDARSGIPGAECSGTIARVGANVRGWKVGDNVLAFAPASFQSFVSVPAEFVTRKPAEMTFAQAAGVPVAFLTAYYGLDRLAKLSAGQSILIHAAAGGLGMAAVQLALRAGARVFATAGSPAKRAFLKDLGVTEVFDSRSSSFRDQVLKATGGAGVDVVLNSLAGELMRASFDVVAAGGSFLEVGKRGIWTPEEVAALQKNIRYFPFDLGDVALENPSEIAGMLHELMERFAKGDLQPLPTALYSFASPIEAFRTMAQARHIGKLVLGFEEHNAPATVDDLVSDGTVLITGGLGALGVETARWLAAHGARNIVLAGRSVRATEELPIQLELREMGVEVSVEQADVSIAEDLNRLLEKIRASLPPLRAVFHAAGVVRDSVLEKESWDSYCEATTPKIQGAWNLHRLTLMDPIRLMVFYSSAASILGSPGQGSYAAGNAFLDALAHRRASLGLRTLSVNWGAWASAGMAARLSSEQTARWARQGSAPMDPVDALNSLQGAIESGCAQAAVLDVGWKQFLGEKCVRRDQAFLGELHEAARNAPGGDRKTDIDNPSGNIVEKIRAALAADREAILSTAIRQCARRVLGLEDSAAIQDNVPLQDIGLDSLMALEMRNELAQIFSVTLPAGLLFDYPSVDQLSQHLLRMLESTNGSSKSTKTTERTTPDLSALSDEEAERLLAEELDRAEGEKANA